MSHKTMAEYWEKQMKKEDRDVTETCVRARESPVKSQDIIIIERKFKSSLQIYTNTAVLHLTWKLWNSNFYLEIKYL